MPVIVICSPTSLETELARTLLWRDGMERHSATRFEDSLSLTLAARPRLLVVDRRLPRAGDLIAAVRKDAAVRECSIVVVSRGDFESSEIDLLEAGANAILRSPPDAGWDERLDRLLNVPSRREARFAVGFAVQTFHDGVAAVGQALNLSAHGILLQTSVLLSVGDSLRFSFPLADATIEGAGVVVRQAGADRFGIYFETLERDGRERIQQHVKTLS